MLLIKFPTRQRKEKFFQVLDLYYEYLTDRENTRFIITCDADDLTMNNDEVRKKFKNYHNLKVVYGHSKTKIEAVNADVPNSGWDILLLASDDMIPKIKGYDQIIRNAMTSNFPDTDGVLWFYDGHRIDLNTLIIIGFKYYKRFNYLYYPGYITWYADDEFMRTANILIRQYKSNTVIIEHQHFAWTGKKPDSLAIKENQLEDQKKDEKLYLSRKQPIIYNRKLSILICTITGREGKFERLINILKPQITDDVEILYSKDNKQYSIGAKRNALLQQSEGKYICFIDDDDRVCENYIALLMKGIEKDVDCCSLTGLMTINGRNYKKFIHSIQYKEYFEKNSILYRPPNHLNVIKSEIAKLFKFPDLNRFEDTKWAMEICNSGLIKNEHWIEEVIYYYDYIGGTYK